ncbi:hypothetical protein P8452_42067 [Trifolium repens]|nr:hypothetical protein P8452_42067 [Trifolium repens]
MASSSSSRNVIVYAVDDKEPVIIDDSEFVSKPDMTSVEDNLWGEELIIPHRLEEAGFDALQQKTPKGKGASKAKETTTSTDTTTPAATQKKSLPNTGAKLRKRNLMATNETGEPTKQKKQKALTINEPTPADDVPTTTNAAAPSGEGQGDKGKANVETSEASMPPKPKKKKKKAKSKSRPSGEKEKDGESPIPTIPVENQPSHVENPSTENHAPSQEKISSSSQNPGAQGGNEDNINTLVNEEEDLAQGF